MDGGSKFKKGPVRTESLRTAPGLEGQGESEVNAFLGISVRALLTPIAVHGDAERQAELRLESTGPGAMFPIPHSRGTERRVCVCETWKKVLAPRESCKNGIY